MHFADNGRLRLLGAIFAMWGIAVACSAGDSGDVKPRTAGGTGGTGNTGATGGSINFAGSGAGIGIAGGSNTGGTGPREIERTPCEQNSECKEGEICVVKSPEAKDITTKGECAPDKGECGEDDICGEDSYCCGEGCRLDNGPKTCIPFDFGQSPDCKLPGGVGVFAPAVQCEWTTSDASKFVLTTPLVANLPNDSGVAAEIVVTTIAAEAYTDKSAPGQIRIISGEDCSLKETIADSVGKVRASSPLALADLNKDGTIEIVARANEGGVMAFKWDGSKYVRMWGPSSGRLSSQDWGGPSIHDLNNDGVPEILDNESVYDSATGNPLPAGPTITLPFNGFIPIAGNILDDGVIRMPVNAGGLTTFAWNGKWEDDKAKAQGAYLGTALSHYAIADFGTPNGSNFDITAFDGIAEIVGVEDSMGGVLIVPAKVNGSAMSGFSSPTPLMNLGANKLSRGGPPTIGDFDGDGQPEVAIAGKTEVAVFDPGCTGAGGGCLERFIRWKQPVQDATSAQTGVSLFDFEGDGKAEVVYADECFLRIYDGSTGDVLFSSYRTSGTWFESPVVADTDNDESTEIVVNNAFPVSCPNPAGDKKPDGTPYIDPLHPGVRCQEAADCVPGGNCVDGFCRCSGASDCDEGLTCAPPVAPASGANTCRAVNPNKPDSKGGIRVVRDRLDRTASSRALWNQHAYSITNINDDGTIPKTSEWLANWKQPGLNNFRMQKQGEAGFQDAPDVTGTLDADKLCGFSDGGVTLTGTVCNRGKKAVGSKMPVTFYDSAGKMLCVAETTENIGGKNDCKPVSCTINQSVSGKITMKVNDNNGGGQTAKECNDRNNEDSVTIENCGPK